MLVKNKLKRSLIGLISIGILSVATLSACSDKEAEAPAKTEQAQNSSAPTEVDKFDVNNTLNITFDGFRKTYNKNLKTLVGSKKGWDLKAVKPELGMNKEFYVYTSKINDVAMMSIRTNAATKNIIDMDISYAVPRDQDGLNSSHFQAMLGFVSIALDSLSTDINHEESNKAVLDLMKQMSTENPNPHIDISGLRLTLSGNIKADDGNVIMYSIEKIK